MNVCLGCEYHAGIRPKLVDLYCCSGGAAMGYFRAGFCVEGVDIKPKPNYPFQLHVADAVKFLARHWRSYVAAHSSPPCQGQIRITKGNRGRKGWTDKHVNLIPDTRAALEATGLPYVIENGPSEHLRPDVELCGLMFGLPILRHRYFEIANWTTFAPAHPGPLNHRGHLTVGWRHGCHRTVEPSVCPKHDKWCKGTVYGVYGKGGGKPTVPQAQAAMGIDWMDSIEDLNEAIPPAYTEWLGRRLLEHLTTEVAA